MSLATQRIIHYADGNWNYAGLYVPAQGHEPPVCRGVKNGDGVTGGIDEEQEIGRPPVDSESGAL
jgi:hypothetical protein